MKDTATDWLKVTRRIFVGICATGAIVASFVFITELALQTGWPPWVAWLLPLCIDALGAMALLQYRTTRDLTAAHVGIGAIAFSALCNAASHWYSAGLLAGNEWFSAGMLTPGFVITTIVGTVPAVSLGICVHLITKEPTHAKPGRTELVEPVGGGAGDTAPPRGAAAVDSTVGQAPHRKTRSRQRVPADGTPPARSDADLAQEVLDHDGWVDLSGDKLAGVLHVAKGRALDARKAAREREAAVPNGYATLVK